MNNIIALKTQAEKIVLAITNSLDKKISKQELIDSTKEYPVIAKILRNEELNTSN